MDRKCGKPWSRIAVGLCLLGLALVVASCARNPVTGRLELHLIQEAEEIQIGEENYLPTRQAQGGDYILDPDLTAYIREVGMRLARVSDRPDLPYEFTIVNNSIPNAWALPGGKIAVNRGLLLTLHNEAELAAVLGHEIVHAAARHTARQIERGLLLQIGVIGLGLLTRDEPAGPLLVGAGALGVVLIQQKYSRDAEREADQYGMVYMARAGYDPKAAVALQETFLRLSEQKEPSWLEGLLATHPPSRERVEANRKMAAALPPGGRRGEETYQAKIRRLRETREAYQALDQAREALSRGRLEEAETLIQRALRIEPREALAYGLLGKIRSEQGRAQEALEAYTQALQRNPDYFWFYLERGQLRMHLGDEAGAREDLERSLALLPTATAHKALGDLALQQGNRREALQHYRIAARSDSRVGREATRALARLEISQQPSRYLRFGFQQTPRGQVILLVKNEAPFPLRRVMVEVEWTGSGGEVLQQDRVLFLRLGPGEVQKQITQLGPLPPTAREELHVRILAIEME